MTNRLGKFMRRHRWVLVLVLVLFAVTPAFVSIQFYQREQGQLIDCLTEWADASSDRSEYLSDLTGNRNQALDQVIRAVAANDEAAFRSALSEYIMASDALESARTATPQPERPSLRCNGG